ncbi:MAG TPA: ABC transporter ATP-binding protein [candidate division Zixibacteria bacterium]|nr:ABC transporter ATP-binding protein [candidate division Zixibacteria bacterium]
MARPEAPAGVEPIISLSGVTRRFNGFTAVRDLSLEVPRGHILGLIGPSGSGKTTTVRMLTGTLRPTAGGIRVMGHDPLHFGRTVRRQIAYMPQLFSLYPDLTARENVGFVAALYGYSWFGRESRIRRALEVVDLWDARDRLARDLSGGMQRRLELACAIVHDPQVLFIDEPTAGIDPMLRVSIWDELREMRDQGRTLLVTTQYVGEAEYCDEVALLAEGELIALDTPEALRQHVYGGDVLEIDTDRAVDPEAIATVGEVMEVRQPAPRRLIVVVPEAGPATPRLMDALRQRGVGVVAIEEYQPSFDEVFTDLVQRRRREREKDANGDGSSPAREGTDAA